MTFSFADIHYYFGTPTVRPLLHRFDKASYFYVYHNPTRQTSRIEVANNPGTPEQDAFSGYLDSCRIINSHRFPTLITLAVDGGSSGASPPSSRLGRDPEEWRLASADPRDPGKQKYRIHTLDIYFWAEEDAKLVIDTCKRMLSPVQLDVAELEQEPAPEKHEDSVHPVVQNLEHVAISDPAYQNGQTRNSQSQVQQHQQQSIPLPPPPPTQQQQTQQHYQQSASVSPVSAISTPGSKPKQQEAPQAFAPMAYNPAAPAAPEPIAHREDTPPPPDDGTGTGLAAATNDATYGRASSQPWTGVPQPNQHGHYGSPPPSQMFGSPPPPPSAPPSFGGPPSAVSGSHDGRHQSIAAQHYVPSPPPPSQAHSQEQPIETPGAQFYSNNSQSPHKPLAHVQPQYADYLSAGSQGTPPPGGYGQFNYGQTQQAQQGSGYDIHSQVYRPTEQESQTHHHSHRPSKTETASSGRKESRVDKVENRIGKLWKKADKKFGIS